MTAHKCPVCGEYEFEMIDSNDICEVCGWQDDAYQERHPDEDSCANEMSLNQAKEAFKNGKEVR